ncbi:rab-GTPase-TBC domain-containing protein [Phellopilus nigrolimitatus]|nr:rab-GTPase-TBC domain-containing protein [Phellopilus nigrolimitatus]
MAWKLFLIPTVPLTPPASQTTAKPPLDALKALRREYTSLLLEKMRAPDGSYEEGFTVPGTTEPPRSSDETFVNLQRNNPLSLHEDNPWKEWFAAVELRKTIRQDVERTFPDIDYFRDFEVQAQLTYILFVYSVMHPDIGYRQGMHELLAPLLYALDYDSLPPGTEFDSDIEDFCSRPWIAADAWALFGVVMEGVSSWYEWREPTAPSLPSPLKAQFHHGAQEGRVELKPYVAPIVLACQKLQAEMLKATDPMLWQGMQKAGIEPQIYWNASYFRNYMLRWLRLLFTREFSLPDAMILWDGIFSYENTFQLVRWICVAMLIRIRNYLIPADYSGQLTSLLRYPSPPGDIDRSCPHHTVLLLRQAFALYTNRNLLHIPLEVPEPEISPTRTRRPNQQAERPSLRSRASTDAPRAGPSREAQRNRPSQQSLQIGLPELFARGLIEKGESLGINKTVMSAVSEIRKNIPELANQLMRTPPPDSAPYSSFPLVSEKPPEERPPWEHRTRFEMEREVASLRSLQKRLGDAVDEGENRDADALKIIRERKREAVESLAHVRDLLKGSAKEIDEERLYGEEEYRRRRQALSVQHTAEAKELPSSPPRPPEPAAAPRAPTEHHRQQSSPPTKSSHPLSSVPRASPVLRSPPEPFSARRVGQAATLPRQAGSPPPLDTFQAPWNYTRSNFTAPSLDDAVLPRPPPRTSQTGLLRPDGPATPSSAHTGQAPPPRQRKASTDPLGAIPP